MAQTPSGRTPSGGHTERGVPIAAECQQRGFHLYTFGEATAGIHVDCLYMILELVRRQRGGASNR